MPFPTYEVSSWMHHPSYKTPGLGCRYQWHSTCLFLHLGVARTGFRRNHFSCQRIPACYAAGCPRRTSRTYRILPRRPYTCSSSCLLLFQTLKNALSYPPALSSLFPLPTSLNTVPHSPLTSCLCTPNTVFPVAHKHTWRRRHWTHHSQTVAQHSAESRHTDPLHTITSRTHDCQNTPRAISFSAAYVHTVRAPGPEDKACPSKLPVSKDAPAQSQHTHSAGASQPTTTLRSGEHSVFHTTLSPLFFWSSRPYPAPG